MKLRLKKRGAFGVKRISVDAKIDKVEKNVNPVNPANHGVNIFFKGLEGMGVLSLSHKEKEMLSGKIVKSVEVVEKKKGAKKLRKK